MKQSGVQLGRFLAGLLLPAAVAAWGLARSYHAMGVLALAGGGAQPAGAAQRRPAHQPWGLSRRLRRGAPRLGGAAGGGVVVERLRVSDGRGGGGHWGVHRAVRQAGSGR